MTLTQEQLKSKYSDQAITTKLKNYNLVTYPHSYYIELLDIIIKESKSLKNDIQFTTNP